MNFKITVLVFGALSCASLCLCGSDEGLGLARHNQVRVRHESQQLKVNKALVAKAESCAQDYAERNAIDHRCASKYSLGENLYWSNGYSPEPSDTVDRAIRDWYDERKDYNYNDPGTKRGVVGHFTQTVWNGSTKTGCAVRTVDGNTVCCCLYEPQGNIGNGDPGADFYEFYKRNVKKPTK